MKSCYMFYKRKMKVIIRARQKNTSYNKLYCGIVLDMLLIFYVFFFFLWFFFFFMIFYPSKCTHSSEHTHTHCEHTPGAVGSCGALGAVGGSVPCLRAPHRGIEGRERARIHSPHRQSLPDRDSNSQPFDYESESLTITPQLPHCWMKFSIFAAGKIKHFFVPSHKTYLLQATVFYSALKRKQPQDKKTLSDLPVLRAFLLLCSKHIL